MSFLGPDAFPTGSYTPKPVMATSGGRSMYRGNIVFTNLDRKLVADILPGRLTLATNIVAPEMHPVIYLYGRPEETSWIIDDKPVMHGSAYQELMLLVPFVQENSGGRYWHTYVARMYLDNGVAIWIGNKYFAYAKEFGTLRESAVDLHTVEVRVFDADDVEKFRADSKRTSPWRPADEAERSIQNFAAMKAILSMPVVGRRLPSNDLVCSYFELSYRHARVARLESRCEFRDAFVPGMGPWTKLGRLSNVVNGAVAVRDVEWRIASPPPEACRF